MNKDSKFYNPEWPDYYCTSCGTLYQFYVDGLCSKCRTHKPIDRTEEKKKNVQFKIDYVKRKQEKHNNTPANRRGIKRRD